MRKFFRNFMKRWRECHFITTQDKNTKKVRPVLINRTGSNERRNPLKEQILHEVQVPSKVVPLVHIPTLIRDKSVLQKREGTIRKALAC